MNIILNGEKISVLLDINLKDLLALKNIKEKNIVIEVNKEIISKNLWSNKNLEENDEIEIVTAVGGG
jgi:sulfur carrier protein|tara:strand:+ start:814 stop:1014 length:201 start_codon:yes stop_codon:yes gene_type:complete